MNGKPYLKQRLHRERDPFTKITQLLFGEIKDNKEGCDEGSSGKETGSWNHDY